MSFGAKPNTDEKRPPRGTYRKLRPGHHWTGLDEVSFLGKGGESLPSSADQNIVSEPHQNWRSTQSNLYVPCDTVESVPTRAHKTQKVGKKEPQMHSSSTQTAPTSTPNEDKHNNTIVSHSDRSPDRSP